MSSDMHRRTSSAELCVPTARANPTPIVTDTTAAVRRLCSGGIENVLRNENEVL